MLRPVLAALAILATGVSSAQMVSAPAAPGTVLVMTGVAELELPNDEAVATFFFETQDADLGRAQNLVNQRVAEGIALLRKADPKAEIETGGYSSIAVYGAGSTRTLVGWRVRQSVSVRTTRLAELPRTVAAAQAVLAVGQIDFRLTRASRERAQAQVIALAIADLKARVNAAADALGVPPARVRLEELNFGSQDGGPVPMAGRMVAMASDSVAQPSLEPGRSIERQTVTGRARLLP